MSQGTSIVKDDRVSLVTRSRSQEIDSLIGRSVFVGQFGEPGNCTLRAERATHTD